MSIKKNYLSLASLSMIFSMLFCTNIYASAPAGSNINNTTNEWIGEWVKA